MKRFTKALAAIMLMMTVVFAVGCEKDDNSNNGGGNNNNGTNENVTVITTTPKDITSTSAVCGGSVSISEGITLSEVGVCWSTGTTPTVAGSHLAAESLEEQFICTVVDLAPNTKYYVCAYAMQGQKCYYGSVKDFITLNNGGGSYNGHDYIDLGLPSGTLWATCNIGSNTPEGDGDYFAWAEIEPKDYYDWHNYKYGYQSSNDVPPHLTKYNTDPMFGEVDNLTILQPEDDVATTKWGNGWQMPTMAQWSELYQNTTGTWVTQNGVEGELFTATNGNSIFLPAAYESQGEIVGWYWSSELSYPLDAYGYKFEKYDGCDPCSFSRVLGLSVRPVRSAN